MALFPLFASKPAPEEVTAFADGDATTSGVTLSAAVQEQVDREADEAAGLKPLPLIGHMPMPRQQRLLLMVLVISVALIGVGLAATLRVTSYSANLLNNSGDALMQSQRVAKSISSALLGDSAGFSELEAGAAALRDDMQFLEQSGSLGPAGAKLREVSPLADATAKGAAAMIKLRPTLTRTNAGLRDISRQTDALLGPSQAIAATLLQQGAPAAQIAAANTLSVLTQSIGKAAGGFVSAGGVNPAAATALTRDLRAFDQISAGLIGGDADQQLTPVKDPQVRAQLATLRTAFGNTARVAAEVLGAQQALSAAHAAQDAVLKDSEPLLQGLQQLQRQYSGQAGVGTPEILFLVASTLLAVLSLVGLARLYLLETRQRAVQADRQRRRAERQELETRRNNEANQAAILRLMNELQNVAEGDLTQQATVTEDITGAIADSVNYTVEELRNLVGQVQTSADQVRRASAQAQNTSGELLTASETQLTEIRETGRSVLDMAERINEVSTQAQQSSDVARLSLSAAEQGLQAVRNSIDGMNAIRTQIQDTSKRIKRLGESSQEIGEITELISDLTEQTNVLALNAAIQAASAGDAGRGFSVVAEEVQRLAERSAEAAKQIAALVRTIQTDTQDAVAAMEKSTQGVVEGARLSDTAGTALSEIDRVSRQLAELIQRISEQAMTEAKSANQVADNIQHIFAVTEQTSQGTRSTADLVAELARVAEVLRESVSRFKIA